MSGKRWLTGLVVAISATNAGCISCDHAAHKSALDAGPVCEVPACERQKVYVFMLNGLAPTASCGLDGLRVKLAEQGFPKIGCGQVFHAAWAADEMKRILCDNPDARFVLLGYDLGGGAAAKLAQQSVQAGLPVDALVLLDPKGKASMTPSGVRTLLITSGAGLPPTPHTESVIIPDVGHFRLPTHPKTLALVCNLLNEVAAKQMRPEIEIYPMWSYEHAPAPRISPLPGDPEWNVLTDRPGGVTLPLGVTETVKAPPLSAGVQHTIAGIPKP
ncbi:MAG TPA: hypothetical protein VMZ71_09875 [Gemmataceae bacterium]|nr:hypothetical protein [Gemmataceae bacterium]